MQYMYKEKIIVHAYVRELLAALKSITDVKRVIKLPVTTGNQNFCWHNTIL